MKRNDWNPNQTQSKLSTSHLFNCKFQRMKWKSYEKKWLTKNKMQMNEILLEFPLIYDIIFKNSEQMNAKTSETLSQRDSFDWNVPNSSIYYTFSGGFDSDSAWLCVALFLLNKFVAIRVVVKYRIYRRYTMSAVDIVFDCTLGHFAT